MHARRIKRHGYVPSLAGAAWQKLQEIAFADVMCPDLQLCLPGSEADGHRLASHQILVLG